MASCNGVLLSFTSASPHSIDPAPKAPFNHPTLSQHSLASPSTPSYDTSGYFESSISLDGPTHSSSANSLGNLADELADAFNDDEDSTDEHGLQGGPSGGFYNRAETIRHDPFKENVHPISRNGVRNGHAISITPFRQGTTDPSLSPPKETSRSKHTRASSQYDGADYGDDSDLEVTHSPVLEARLAAVESLARQCTQANGGDADRIVQRMADSLKNLKPQAEIDNGATR